MSLYQQGITLKALLEDPNLLNPPKIISEDKKDKKKDDDGFDLFDGQSAFLGPSNLWDKTLPYDENDFKLEYMDLDEFLQENGIPLAADGTPLVAETTPKTSPQAKLKSVGPPSSPCISESLIVNPNTQSPVRSNSPSPTSALLKKELLKVDVQFGQQVSPTVGRTPSPAVDVPFEVEEHEMALATIPVSHHFDASLPLPPDYHQVAIPTSPEHQVAPGEDEEGVVIDANPEDLLLAQCPGDTEFDPRKRRFTAEELRPQPMIKKSKKVFVPTDAKDDKYWARRNKNNVAAKRSRDARRIKENQIALRASYLERESEQLRVELKECRKENAELIRRLSKYEKVEGDS